MSFEVFSPIRSHANENDKNCKKSKLQNFGKQQQQQQKWSVDVVKRYIFTEFGIDVFDGFWENGFYRRRTDDGRPCDDSSSAVQ